MELILLEKTVGESCEKIACIIALCKFFCEFSQVRSANSDKALFIERGYRFLSQQSKFLVFCLCESTFNIGKYAHKHPFRKINFKIMKKTVDNAPVKCYYVNKVEVRLRRVSVQRATRPMKCAERQSCRRAVFGTFRSGCMSNRYTAVIMCLMESYRITKLLC